MINSEIKSSSIIGLHQISPYKGKLRPELAKHLIEKYTNVNNTICDPFCGSGTIPLEGWIANRNVIASDLNIYAYVLTYAKLHPYNILDDTLNKLNYYNEIIKKNQNASISNNEPKWVQNFFHKKTYKELLQWRKILIEHNEWFILSCLLGILHHQRPGFLSYPASHSEPYLRTKNFPKSEYPELYEYRNVFNRLWKKVIRAYKNFPKFDYSLNRNINFKCASNCINDNDKIDAIITSPPYMKALSYGRDNRLRLWLIGENDWQSLDKKVSPNYTYFNYLMNKSFSNWSEHQKSNNIIIIIIGDMSANNKTDLSDLIENIAILNGYKTLDILCDPIPYARRIIKSNQKIKSEKIMILQKV